MTILSLISIGALLVLWFGTLLELFAVNALRARRVRSTYEPLDFVQLAVYRVRKHDRRRSLAEEQGYRHNV